MCLRQVQQFRRRCSPEAYSWAVQGLYSLMFSSVYEIDFSVSSCWRCFPCDICYIVGKFFRQAEFAIYLKIIVTFCTVVASWTNSENIGFQQAHQHFWYIAWMKSASNPTILRRFVVRFRRRDFRLPPRQSRCRTSSTTSPLNSIFGWTTILSLFPILKNFLRLKKLIQKIITLYKKYIVKKILLLLCSILKNYFKYLVGFKVI